MEVECWHSECLEKDFGGLDTIARRVEWRLRQQYWMVLGVDLQLVENVAPDVLHIIPVFDDTMLDWVTQLDHTLVLLDVLAYEEILLERIHHNFLVLCASNTIPE